MRPVVFRVALITHCPWAFVPLSLYKRTLRTVAYLQCATKRSFTAAPLSHDGFSAAYSSVIARPC